MSRSRPRGRAVTVGLAAAAAVAWGEPAEAAFPGTNGEIAYHGRASAAGLLYVRAADGDRLRRLRVPCRPTEPAFSPLGRRIVLRAVAASG